MFEDDASPRAKITHLIGQDLSLLSIEEIDERIAQLQAEITRLSEARSAKIKTQAAADALFKR